MINISFINAATGITDIEAERVMADLQIQVTRDFFPVWGVDANLVYVSKAQKPRPGTWWLTLLDNSDQAGALGYHDLTSEGLPIGKAFVKTCKAYGESWTVDASHELLEMLADPDINLLCMDESGSTLCAYEVGDPVQDDACGYKIDDTLVSDFVYPAFFEPSRVPESTQFSHQKSVTRPLSLAKGGYISYMNFNSPEGWQQQTDRENARRAPIGSRRERRRTPKALWLRSTAP